MEKKVTATVLYKDENFLWFGFNCNQSRRGNVTTLLRFFIYLCVSLYLEFFLKKSFQGVCTCHNCFDYGKV